MFRAAFYAAAAGMSLVDVDGAYREVNGALCRMLDRTEEDLRSRRFTDVVHPGHRARLVAFHERLVRGERDDARARVLYVRPDGTTVWSELAGSVVRDGERAPMVLVQHFDVTAEQHHTEDLAHRAMHDDLTDLANRALLRDRLTSLLARTGRRESRGVAFYLDLDGFKAINDRLGHPAGDEVLRETAQRLLAVVRAGDTVARVGGDEFVVLGEVTSLREARRLAERIGQALRPPIHVGREQLDVTVSIGVAMTHAGDVADGLLARADRALLKAKRLQAAGTGTRSAPEPHPTRAQPRMRAPSNVAE